MTDADEICSSSLNEENQKFAYEVLRREIEATRDKAWKIFSWTTTILLGTIGGLITIVSKSSPANEVLPCWPHRALLFVAIIILSLYASLWVRQNLRLEEKLLKQVKQFEIKMGISKPGEKTCPKPWFGYRLTIVLLALAALTATYFIPSQCSLR